MKTKVRWLTKDKDSGTLNENIGPLTDEDKHSAALNENIGTLPD